MDSIVTISNDVGYLYCIVESKATLCFIAIKTVQRWAFTEHCHCITYDLFDNVKKIFF